MTASIWLLPRSRMAPGFFVALLQCTLDYTKTTGRDVAAVVIPLVSLLLVDTSPNDCFHMPLASLLDCSWTPLVAMVVLRRFYTYLTLVRPCKTEGTLSIFSKKNIKKPLHVCKFHQRFITLVHFLSTPGGGRGSGLPKRRRPSSFVYVMPPDRSRLQLFRIN